MANLSLGNTMVNTDKEIEPPWVYAPEFEPARAFWRQEGELWFTMIWLPFWESLNQQERDDYLYRWSIPEVWRKYSYHINPHYKEWVDSLDPDLEEEPCNEQVLTKNLTDADPEKWIISWHQILFIFFVILAASLSWLLFD